MRLVRRIGGHRSIKEAIEYFGITAFPETAGYILPDGRFLDFDQRGDGRERTADHREVAQWVEDLELNLTEAMNVWMQETGAVRIGWLPDGFVLDAKTLLTQEQKMIIGRLMRRRPEWVAASGFGRESQFLEFPSTAAVFEAMKPKGARNRRVRVRGQRDAGKQQLVARIHEMFPEAEIWKDDVGFLVVLPTSSEPEREFHYAEDQLMWLDGDFQILRHDAFYNAIPPRAYRLL